MWQIIVFLFWYIVVPAAISYGIAELARKKPEGPDDALPGKFESPSIEEGKTFPVVFGMPKRIENPIMAWWGDTQAVPVYDSYKEPSGPFNSKDKYYVSGYQYKMGVHFILCHGPIDGIKQIHVGEKRLWPHDKTLEETDGMTSIGLWAKYHKEFYGGDSRGGGINGTLSFRYGGASQSRYFYLEEQLGTTVSAYRGLVSVVLRKIRIGHSPYPNKWSFTVKRTDILDDGSAQWYIAKADIDNDLNPAHIIRECYTNTRWGLGYNTSLFPAVVWEAAADTLYDEDFGISRLWRQDSESLEDFIVDILRHIDGLIYQDPQTGNIILKLIRDDYDADSLDEYNESDILELSDFIRPSLGEIPNVYEIIYSDILANKAASLPDQNIALINQQGGKMLPVAFEYAGITKGPLAGRVLARDRNQATSMAVTMKLRCKRTMSSLLPGDVFKLAMPSHNIVEMIVRVMPNAKYGTLESGEINLKVMEDVFSTEDSLFNEPPESEWSEPYTDAVPATSLLLEAPFWALVKRLGKSLALSIDDEAGYLMAAGEQPSEDSIDYEILVRNGLTLNFLSKATVNFTAAPLTEVTMPLNAEDMVLTLDSDLEGIAAGSYAIIDSEIVKVLVDIDSGGTQLVYVARGCLDTVPALHAIGTRMWFIGTVSFLDADELTDGDQPGVKLLPLTGNGRLEESAAPIDNAPVFNSRQDRPYPPGNVRINGESYPDWFASDDVESGETAGVTISWSHRDRIQQTNYIVEHSEGNIGPEEGTTYNLQIYDEDDVLCHTELGLTGTSFFYSEAQEISDCGEIQIQLRIELNSVRT